jgi:hypothetical protein
MLLYRRMELKLPSNLNSALYLQHTGVVDYNCQRFRTILIWPTTNQPKAVVPSVAYPYFHSCEQNELLEGKDEVRYRGKRGRTREVLSWLVCETLTSVQIRGEN